VSHFVDNNTDHAVLHLFRIRAVGVGPTAVERNHGVFHAAPGGTVARDGDRIRVLDSPVAVGFQRVLHHTGRVLTPQRIAFFRVKRHAPDFTAIAVHVGLHCVPNELPAAGEGEIADVFGFINPGFLALHVGGFGFFSNLGFGLRHN